MNSKPWSSWGAQVPSPEFAERAVEAMLEDRRARYAPRSRRWLVALAAAAVLAAGGAWGLAAHSSRPVAVPVVALSPPSTPAPSIDPIAEPPSAPSSPPLALLPRRKVRAPTHARDAGTKPILPRCNCSPNDAICDCINLEKGDRP
jgi:hypothetical protein